MFQLMGAARTLNAYGSHTKIYEEKRDRAIHKLKVFRKEQRVNYLDIDDKGYATECQLIGKLRKIELKRDISSQSTSIGLANAALKSVLPGPLASLCDVASTATRSFMQADEGEAGAMVAMQAVAQKEVQRACLKEATAMAADVAGTAVTAVALPATIATGVLVGTGAAIFSADARTTMWNGLSNAVNGGLALTKDWKDRLFGVQNNHQKLIDFHAAIGEVRKKLFDKKDPLAIAKSSIVATEARLHDVHDQCSEVQRKMAHRQTHWFSRLVYVISTADCALLNFVGAIFCYLSSSYKEEHQWYHAQVAQLKALNNEHSRASDELSQLHTRVHQLSRDIDKRISRIASLENEFLQILHTANEAE